MNKKNTETRKFCPRCKKYLTRDKFRYQESRYDKCSPYCDKCMKEKGRERYLKRSNPSRRNLGIIGNRKKCSDCKKWIIVTKFNKNKSNGDGLQRICKKCQYDREKKYKLTENGKERDKKYRDSEKGKKAYKKANRRYKKTEKYKKNSLYRNISSSIRHSLKESKKDGSWTELVDFTLDELKEHLERQFGEGISWDNYGEWHIDHIRPIASFSITDCQCEDFKKCWSLDNLQPLWAKENQSKGSKWKGKDWRFYD